MAPLGFIMTWDVTPLCYACQPEEAPWRQGPQTTYTEIVKISGPQHIMSVFLDQASNAVDLYNFHGDPPAEDVFSYLGYRCE